MPQFNHAPPAAANHFTSTCAGSPPRSPIASGSALTWADGKLGSPSGFARECPKNVRTGAPFVLAKGAFADDFQVFAMEWEQGVLRWYVDGALYQRQTKWVSDGGPFPAPCD